MTLKFHTLEHIDVCCLLWRNLGQPRLRSYFMSADSMRKTVELGRIANTGSTGIIQALLDGE